MAFQMPRGTCPWQFKGQRAAGTLAKALSTRQTVCLQLLGPHPSGTSVPTVIHISFNRLPAAWSHLDLPVLHLTLPLLSRPSLRH